MIRARHEGGPQGNVFAHASASERYARSRPYFHPDVIQRVRGTLRLNAPVERALDVGCGTGQSTLALRDLARLVVGVDTSTEMLAHAPSKAGIEYVVAQAEQLPFGNDSFDLLTVALAFHWFNRALFLDEARRVLLSSAWLVIYDNAFHGIMLESPQFREWMRSGYRTRYPSPPRDRRPVMRAETEIHGFHFAKHERDSNIVSFSPVELVDYLMTQSNVIAAIEERGERPSDVYNWLVSATLPLFPKTQASFQFGGTITYLQKR